LHDGARAWKGFEWEAMYRLHEREHITDPRGKAKSVVFTESASRAAACCPVYLRAVAKANPRNPGLAVIVAAAREAKPNQGRRGGNEINHPPPFFDWIHQLGDLRSAHFQNNLEIVAGLNGERVNHGSTSRKNARNMRKTILPELITLPNLFNR
jgi:hypothetical protein